MELPPSGDSTRIRAGGSRAKWILLVVVTAVVCAADQGTKQWAQTDLQHRPGRRLVLVEGYAALSYVRNPGAAWGFLSRSRSSVRRPRSARWST